MPQSQKIVTCSYCGTRAALMMDRARHELVCSACGAPLHDIKMMPVGTPAPARKAPAGARVDRETERRHAPGKTAPLRRAKKPPKRRKPFGRKVLSEIWDAVEDLFD